MAGWVSQLPELAGGDVPILYWEQGHESLFGDFKPPHMAESIRAHLEACYHSDIYLAAVSETVAQLLKVRYGRDAMIIPDGIDGSRFAPGRLPGNGTVLLVGNPAIWFKGFGVALRTLLLVWSAGIRFKVKWVCQVQPTVNGLPFPIEYYVNPSQEQIPQIYQSADILLFTSWYEGFALPPLEAMACGLPVVATQSGGISTYAVHQDNAFIVEPGDVQSLASALAYLLQHPHVCLKVGKRARQTALRYEWKNVANVLENTLFEVSRSV
jgi:glycosyltransferase involved in cell wall biosynthesis